MCRNILPHLPSTFQVFCASSCRATSVISICSKTDTDAWVTCCKKYDVAKDFLCLLESLLRHAAEWHRVKRIRMTSLTNNKRFYMLTMM